ncbi:hypothetical protein CDV31_008825 [Fusarium ambrosium]|uniref:Uncharacterized protein n=1 Tax=Fusarium ambrosium TaxID=131363 RepID=A0A428TY70_9HYPO|nr:hypothetical protein CDV31_008825 [Fusarium ambrosium]
MRHINSTDSASDGPTGTGWTHAAVIGLATIPVIITIAVVGWVIQVRLANHRKPSTNETGGNSVATSEA